MTGLNEKSILRNRDKGGDFLSRIVAFKMYFELPWSLTGLSFLDCRLFT